MTKKSARPTAKTKNPVLRATDPPASRLAVRSTWQPEGRIERTIEKRRVVFLHPAQLIADAAALVPECDPVQVSVTCVGNKKTPCFPNLHLSFGCLRRGESTSVRVELEPREAQSVAEYLIRTEIVVFATIFTEPKPKKHTADDDGGDGLPVPSAADALVAMSMPAVGGIQ